MLCENFSLTHICSTCQTTFLTPQLYKRKLQNGIEVISFYKYGEIKDLIHSKHTDIGYYIYTILAKLSFSKFSTEFRMQGDIVSIGIDDNVTSGYSHTSILNKALKSKSIKPLYNKLRARNPVSYSGKSREFRLLNPRDFQTSDFKEKNVILVDDVITTGSTLNQAILALRAIDKEVILCLTLTDAQVK